MNISDLLGLPVLLVEQSEKIGEVLDAVPHQQKGQLEYLIIHARGSNKIMIPWTQIYALGLDALLIRSHRDLIQLNEEVTGVAELWLNKEIYTDLGQCLGRLVDIEIAAKTGEIVSYELSDGLLSDLYFGRHRMPYPLAQVVGSKCLIVPATAAIS